MNSPQRILVIGAGFAGMWSALGAARLIDNAGKDKGPIEVTLIAPQPMLHLRPRLHETAPLGMQTPLLPLFEATGVQFVQGHVDKIRPEENCVDAVGANGEKFTLPYDRLVLTTGSHVHRPEMPGLREHAHTIDQVEEARLLEMHLARLADLPDTPARNTAVVVGGGFTGIEIAAELPARLRASLGHDADLRVIVIEQADAIGPDLGPGPRPVIEEALGALKVECLLNTAVTAVDAEGLTTSTGQRIDALTVIWTAGLRASTLTQHLPAERDRLGRLHVTPDLRVAGVHGVFAAGDVAFALTDDDGHHALMSCQHAMTMGRIAGHNVAADLMGIPTIPYQQIRYVTCLDLGGWGAVLTEGWDRQVQMVGAEAKALKRTINTQWIYPPAPDRAAAFAAADPAVTVVA